MFRRHPSRISTALQTSPCPFASDVTFVDYRETGRERISMATFHVIWVPTKSMKNLGIITLRGSQAKLFSHQMIPSHKASWLRRDKILCRVATYFEDLPFCVCTPRATCPKFSTAVHFVTWKNSVPCRAVLFFYKTSPDSQAVFVMKDDTGGIFVIGIYFIRT